jgi:hypothetical protein
MADWCHDRDRLKSQAQIKNKDYMMITGDFIRFKWQSNGKKHSRIFMYCIDNATEDFDNETRFRTIEGNTASTAGVCTRRLGDLSSGKHQVKLIVVAVMRISIHSIFFVSMSPIAKTEELRGLS